MLDENMEKKIEAFENHYLNVPYSLQTVSEREFLDKFVSYTAEKKYSFLPELINILSLKQVLQLFYIFADQSLEIPKQAVLENALRDLDIYFVLRNSEVDGKPKKEDIKRLSSSYNLTEQAINIIYGRVVSKLNNS